MDRAADDDRIWIQYTRQKAFPISAGVSIIIHATLIAAVLLGLLSLFAKKEPEFVDFEEIIIGGTPGGGAGGTDVASGFGETPTRGVDARDVIAPRPSLPVKLPSEPIPVPKPDTATEPVTADAADARSALDRKLENVAPVPSVRPLVKGLLDAPPARTGVGQGTGKGTGTGSGTGDGDGGAGRLSQKQKRQLRWTLIFSTSGAADYLDQLSRMKAIIGVQYPDKSIKLVTDLRKRPAKLEAGDRVPDRIFWMDDNPEGVQALAEELGIKPLPWRVIAFFPASLEEELLRREKAFGKRFGRESEDDFQETVFRVDDRYGNIEISVTRQTGKK